METAETELHYDTPFHLLIAVILSAQCTDKRVNIHTPAIFQRFPEPADLASASFDEVYEMIRSISFPNNKAKHLIGMASKLVTDFGSIVPSEPELLETLPGVGRKTANVIASVIYNKPVIAVDTHVFRVSRRIGLSDGNTVEAVEKDLTAGFAPELRGKAHHWLILHGRYVCTARKPKCHECGIRDYCREYRLSEGFTNPFRYIPHPLIKEAARRIMERLEDWKGQPDGSPLKELERSFAEGKMLGVLIVTPDDRHPRLNRRFPHFLAAFSGTVRGADGNVTGMVEGFVPPIIDLTAPEGYFKKEEAAISQLNARISDLSSSSELARLQASLKKALIQRDTEIAQMQENIRRAKSRREELRQTTSDSQIAHDLIRESQFQKAELKRLKDRWRDAIEDLTAAVEKAENEISELKTRRAKMSDALQKWIFENATVHNALGESASIWDIFANEGLIPPGGTGDCAAPKLLEYAFRNGLRPLAMGEFWYGKSPETAVRTHGHFYPSCTSKCGPLLGFMMRGLRHPIRSGATNLPVIIHEDKSVIVVEKPSGMPSVPGLDGRKSLQEWLCEHCEAAQSIQAVHRLDMDTSGVMIFAKTPEAAVNLRRQFEEHTIQKTYMARVSPSEADLPIKNEAHKSGSTDLPLAPDYDERPRQKVDFKQGKEAHTIYEIIKVHKDGTADLLLHPHTGRTHQLRVHCAHTLGLGRPILGDLLYGAHTVESHTHPSRLCLHALSITFRHPDTDEPLTFTSSSLAY